MLGSAPDTFLGGGLQTARKLLDEGQAGDNVGVLLRGTKREEVERGQVQFEPGRPPSHAHFPCTAIVSLVYLTESGGSAEIAVVGNDGVLGISRMHERDYGAECFL